MNAEKHLPLSMVTLIFGVLSVLLAFAVHLVSLAVVLALMAVAFGFWGRFRAKGRSYSQMSLKRSRWGLRAGLVGLACSAVMWWLWASNILLG
ncbi:MAG: hypothetical protein IPJ76_18105 [Flavobacteriales bacterium]|nr:MAG: hypothetical protein IPJ76_18105 [Flavobacteriales bacterium]